MEIAAVLAAVRNICLAGTGVCAVTALIMFAIGKMSPQAENGISEGKMMGLILGAIAFAMAAALVTTITVNASI